MFVVWQCSEIWTIIALSLLKYTFVTITTLPLALRRGVPGRTSLIGIPPEGLAKSVQPEIHVCAVGGCSGDDLFLAGEGFWIWFGMSCLYLSISLDQIRTDTLPSSWAMKPCTTSGPAGSYKMVILSPIAKPGPVFVQLSARLVSRRCMKVGSVGISKSPWVGKLTVAMRSPWMMLWDLMMVSVDDAMGSSNSISVTMHLVFELVFYLVHVFGDIIYTKFYLVDRVFLCFNLDGLLVNAMFLSDGKDLLSRSTWKVHIHYMCVISIMVICTQIMFSCYMHQKNSIRLSQSNVSAPVAVCYHAFQQNTFNLSKPGVWWLTALIIYLWKCHFLWAIRSLPRD